MKIPYLSIPDKPITRSTQDYLPIAEIVDDLVLLKNGGAAMVFESSALNFGLLSEKEQQAVVSSYAALLNSLSFPLQIVVSSKRKDITSYLDYLQKAEEAISNPKLLRLVSDYKKFLQEAIKKKNVLSKRFYIVIPFSPYELGVSKSFAAFTKRKTVLPFPKSYVLKKAKIVLYPKKEHLIRQIGRLGIKIRQLTTNELVDLYYRSFSPEIS